MSPDFITIQKNRVKVTAIISGLMLAISVYFSIRNNREASKTFEEYQNSSLILNGIESVLSIVKDAETGQRGYLITGREEYLDSYKAAQYYIDGEFNNLQMLLLANGTKKSVCDSLKTEIDRMLSDLILTKRYAEKINFEVNDSMRTRMLAGKRNMDEVRNLVKVLKEKEEARFKFRKEAARKKSNATTYVVLFTSAASLLIFISLIFNLNRTINLQRLTQEELIKKQEQLNTQIHKLKVSNNELEQFAYVASHDLQEPLRKIISFSEMVVQKSSGSESMEVKGYLDRLMNSAARMRTLIQDLLRYSRSTKIADVDEDVDMNLLFKNILEDLDSAITKSNARITVDDMPHVRASETQLRQLFQNLLTNAIKFRKEGRSPVIKVESFIALEGSKVIKAIEDFVPKHSKYLLIKVSDNGIGFEQQYAEQIFIIFKRLHGHSDYEGTGIGLSVVKKIAENHSGFITAKGEPGKGAIFTVGLPIK